MIQREKKRQQMKLETQFANSQPTRYSGSTNDTWYLDDHIAQNWNPSDIYLGEVWMNASAVTLWTRFFTQDINDDGIRQISTHWMNSGSSVQLDTHYDALYIPELVLNSVSANVGVNGAIRFNGTNFQGYKNGNWYVFDSGPYAAPDDTYIQFNQGGNFGALKEFRFDYTDILLTVGPSNTANTVHIESDWVTTYPISSGSIIVGSGITQNFIMRETSLFGTDIHDNQDFTQTSVYGNEISNNTNVSQTLLIGSSLSEIDTVTKSLILGSSIDIVNVDLSVNVGYNLYNRSYKSVLIGFHNSIYANSTGVTILNGSYNIISGNTLNSTILGGYGNSITGSTYSSIIGGSGNYSIGDGYSSVIGGAANYNINTVSSSVIGGEGNYNDNSQESSVIGGWGNYNSDSTNSVVLGGNSNTNDFSVNSIIVGGSSNYNNGSDYSSVISGSGNTNISVYYSSILGGLGNLNLNSLYSVILGGSNNTNDNCNTAILGGFHNNSISSDFSLTFGGAWNANSNSDYSSIINGKNNTNYYSDYSSVIGGTGNTNTYSIYSFVAAGSGNYNSSSDYSSVIGGSGNYNSSSDYSSVIGGGGNYNISSDYSSVIGGSGNYNSNSYYSSVIGGGSNYNSSCTNTAVIVCTGVTATRSNTVYMPNILLTNTDDSSPIEGFIVFDGTHFKGYKSGTWYNFDGAPAAPDLPMRSIQFNDDGVFGGDARLSWIYEGLIACSSFTGGGTMNILNAVVGGGSHNISNGTGALLNTIVGGTGSEIRGVDNIFNNMLGGAVNKIWGQDNNFNTIINGAHCEIGNDTIFSQNNNIFNIILGGAGSYLHCRNSTFNTIIGGSGNYVNDNSNFNIVGGGGSSVSGQYNLAIGDSVRATNASGGATAFGVWTWASGLASFASNYATVASGYYSHSTGKWTLASGEGSFSGGIGATEGCTVNAVGYCSFNFSYNSQYSNSNSGDFSVILGGENLNITSYGKNSSIISSIVCEIGSEYSTIISSNSSSIGLGSSNLYFNNSIITSDTCSIGDYSLHNTIIGCYDINMATTTSYIAAISLTGLTLSRSNSVYVPNVILKNTDNSTPEEGMIIFDGTHFKGYTSGGWKQLDNV